MESRLLFWIPFGYTIRLICIFDFYFMILRSYCINTKQITDFIQFFIEEYFFFIIMLGDFTINVLR